MFRLIFILPLLCFASNVQSERTVYCHVLYSSTCGFYNEKIVEGEKDVIIKANHWNTTDNDITEIRFEDSSVWSIPVELFDIFQNVQYFFMNNQNVHEIEPGTFTNANILLLLSLSNNTIKELYKGIFDGAWKLRTILFDSGAVEFIHEDAFVGLTELQKLDLGNNYIKTLGENTFISNIDLIFLDLNNNSLETVPRKLFANSQLLSRINLNNNQISSLNYDTFSSNKEMSLLFLSDNKCIDKSWVNATVPEVEHTLRFCSMPIAEASIDSLNKDFGQLMGSSFVLNEKFHTMEVTITALSKSLNSINDRISKIEEMLEILSDKL